MIAIASVLLVLALSLLVVRVGSIALVMTGLPRDVARFQALSAFSGAGFTTSESEEAVDTPARRQVTALLIRLGAAGIVTAISTLMLSFVSEDGVTPTRLLVLLAGAAFLVALARSDRLEAWTTPLIRRVLARTTPLDLRDYAALLHLRDGYKIGAVEVRAGGWLAGHPIGELALGREGVVVLAVEDGQGQYEGAPGPEVVAQPGGRLVLYGRAGRLAELASRRAGEHDAHEAAAAETAAQGEARHVSGT